MTASSGVWVVWLAACVENPLSVQVLCYHVCVLCGTYEPFIGARQSAK